MYTRYEMLDIVLIKDENGEPRARGIIARNLVTGRIERFFAHAVVVGSGGYGNTFFLSTNAMASNGSAAMQMYRHGALFANPCYAQIHPTCIPKDSNDINHPEFVSNEPGDKDLTVGIHRNGGRRGQCADELSRQGDHAGQ